MKKDKIRPKQSIDLRKRAEELLSKKPEDIQDTVGEDTQKLIHELEVYQIELEMQNEELRKAQAELEESRSKYFDLYDLAPIGYFTFNQKGLILEVNLTGAELLGVERKYLLKRGFSRFVVPDFRDVFHWHCQRTLATGTRQTCDLKLVKKDKKQFYAQLQSTVAQDAEGSFIQLRTAISDLTDLKKAEQAVQETRRYAENIVQTVREPLVVLDESLRVVSANRSFYQTFEVTPEETIEEFIYDLGNGQWDIARLHDLLEMILSSNTFFENFEVEHEFETLGKRLMLLNARRLHTATKGIHLILLAIEDITERKRIEKALRESEAKYRLLVDNLPNIVFKGYKDWSVDFIDDKIELLTGYTKEEFNSRKMKWIDIVVKEDIERIKEILKQALGKDQFYLREYRIKAKTGETLWIQEGSQIVCDDRGEIVFLSGAFLDITERKLAEEKISYLAYYDSVTDLPNRQLFEKHMCHALAYAKRHDRQLATLFLDLDHFKHINDKLGHRVGDLLLKSVAGRLKEILRNSDFISRYDDDKSFVNIARFGGDEFLVLLTDIKQARDVANVAGRILQELSNTFVLDSYQISINGSIGISLYPSDGEDIETLIKNADAAMYHAKNSGRNNYQFYVDSVKFTTSEKSTLGADLRMALERGELILYYQPQLDINTEKIIGTEALIRWLHPDFGLVSPREFIPLAEDNDLIEPITKWVLRTACAQNMAWQAAGFPPMRVGVNVSNLFLKQRKFVETLSQILSDTGMAPYYLEIELMESALMRNEEETIRELMQVKAMGVRVAIDDFGTGSSSLACLKSFPLDALKIDRSFVKDISTDRDSATITAAIITMAHSLQLNVIAEGVETQQQLTFLRAQGCDEMQGYLFSQPIPSSDIIQFLPAGSH